MHKINREKTMGLDITAYSKACRIEDESTIEMDEDNFPVDEDIFRIFSDEWNRSAPFLANSYVSLKESECHGFRAGSYGYYNVWRNELARIAGYEPTNEKYDQTVWDSDGGPFFELINFSDCEGILGADVSEKLFNDFINYSQQVTLEKFKDKAEFEWFEEKYKDFTKAFALAQHGGFVYFH